MSDKSTQKFQNTPSKLEVSLNPDVTPILYTDNINMQINDNGVILNVVQHMGTGNKARIVSRIGMSKEHAKKFVQKLSEVLLLSEGKKNSKVN